jgi:hypothetical protein
MKEAAKAQRMKLRLKALQEEVREDEGAKASKKAKKRRSKKTRKLKPLDTRGDQGVDVYAVDPVTVENVALLTHTGGPPSTIHSPSKMNSPTKLDSPSKVEKQSRLVEERLMYAKFKHESDWLKAVLKERKAQQTLGTVTVTAMAK